MATASLVEIVYEIKDDGVESWSLSLSFIILACNIAIMAITAWQFFKSEFNYTFYRMIYFRELFRGLRVKWLARSYALVQIARKFVLIF